MIAWLIAVALATETPLIAPASTWSYWDQGVDPGPAWATLGFDDSAWGSGPGPLGYGAVGLATTVGYGPNALDRYITTWFRHEFTATGTNAFTGLALHLRRDDGAIVWLDGAEIYRTNLPAGPIDADTRATTALNGLIDQEILRIPLDAALVPDGDHVLAVEVHQADPTSFDLSMEAWLSGWDDAGAVTRGPYLQSMDHDSVIVRWRTEGPTPSRVWTGAAPGALNTITDDPALALDHEVLVSGLSARTTYSYAIGSPATGMLAGDDADHHFTTNPAPGAVRPVRFWVLGDAGTGNASQEAVRDAFLGWSAGVDPDHILLLGDNAYNSGTDDEYQLGIFDIYTDTLRRVPMWSTIGNHDGYSASSLTQTGPYFEIFSLPKNGENGGVASGTEAYNSFDIANVHLINLDANGSTRTPGSPMLTWLEADLAAATADWVIVSWHHPPYSRGSHNSDSELNMVEMRQYVNPILEAWGTDLVLGGHSHSYERSYLVDGHYGLANTLDRPLMLLDEGDGNELSDGPYRKHGAGMNPNQGAVYVVAGSAGKVSGGALDHPVHHASINELGSLILDIDGDRLDAVFLDDAGNELDTFSIVKSVATITAIDGAREGTEGEPLSFTAAGVLANGTPITSFDWDFGDGTPMEFGTDTVEHTWPAEGEWHMSVHALDDAGQPFSEVAIVRVVNGPPVVDPLTPPAACDEGEPLTWYGTATDPGGDAITYAWDFGDGTVLAGQQVVHGMGDDGPFVVRLTATDDGGLSGSQTMIVTCDNRPPTLQGLVHPPLIAGDPVSISALVTDPGRLDTFTIDWSIGGAPPVQGPSLDTTFVLPGSYALDLTITDDDGGVTDVSVVLDVTDGPPILDLLSMPASVGEGQSVAMAVLAHDDAGEPFTVTWDFGDGETAIGQQVEHAWAQDGWYTVSVVLDDGLERAEHVVDLQVVNLAPTVDQVEVSDGVEGSPMALAALVSDPGADPLTVTWTFGFVTVEGDTAWWTPPHDGAFAGTVSVVDDEGLGESAPFVYAVANAPPRFTGLPDITTAFVDEEWLWRGQVTDPGHDALTWDLTGPPGAWVGPDGLVHWVPDDEDEGTEPRFQLTAYDDGMLDDTVSWRVVVRGPRAGPHGWFRNGCDQTGGAPTFGGLALLAWVATRRRRAR